MSKDDMDCESYQSYAVIAVWREISSSIYHLLETDNADSFLIGFRVDSFNVCPCVCQFVRLPSIYDPFLTLSVAFTSQPNCSSTLTTSWLLKKVAM